MVVTYKCLKKCHQTRPKLVIQHMHTPIKNKEAKKLDRSLLDYDVSATAKDDARGTKVWKTGIPFTNVFHPRLQYLYITLHFRILFVNIIRILINGVLLFFTYEFI